MLENILLNYTVIKLMESGSGLKMACGCYIYEKVFYFFIRKYMYFFNKFLK